MRICTIEGCEKPCKANRPTLCSAHARRIEKHGDPHAVMAGGRPVTTGPTTYNSAHRALFRARGSAKSQACIDCGEQAREWSLRHDAAVRLVGVNVGYPMAFSPNPDDYEPRCRPCHVAYDRRAA